MAELDEDHRFGCIAVVAELDRDRTLHATSQPGGRSADRSTAPRGDGHRASACSRRSCNTAHSRLLSGAELGAVELHRWER